MRQTIKAMFASMAVTAMGLFLLAPVVSLAGGLFYIDSATGYAGFGNTTPQSQVDVSGAIYSRLVTASSSAINWNAGNVQSMTLSSSPTLTFSNGQAGGQYELVLNQDATGGRTVTWPASVKWPSGTAPTLTSTAGGTDAVRFTYDGSRYLGDYSLNYSTSTSISVLVVAGGGGGGGGVLSNTVGGGGGAGGLITETPSSLPHGTYTITVGSGGNGGSGSDGSNGSNSSIGSFIVATGGGGGSATGNGASGGSGGGGKGDSMGAGSAGTGTVGQGYNGGNGFDGAPSYGGGGGGGASATGGNAISSIGGTGGNGISSNISGSTVTYAGGGGGGGNDMSGGSGQAGPGGSGGGGGGGSQGQNGSNATTNTGSGGGGGSDNVGGSAGTGGNGGAGIVIIEFPTSSITVLDSTGATQTTSGGDTILTWTSGGTFEY